MEYLALVLGTPQSPEIKRRKNILKSTGKVIKKDSKKDGIELSKEEPNRERAINLITEPGNLRSLVGKYDISVRKI